MRTVLLEPEGPVLAALERRSHLGLDGRDETWEGVVHVVPPASGGHQRLGARVLMRLGPVAESRGLVASYETGLFAADEDYRVPDQLYCRPDQVSDRGAEGAELVVEVRSPRDETYAKLGFYAARGVREVLVLHPGEERVELFRAVGDAMAPVTSDREGAVRSEVLGVRLVPRPGGLRLEWDGGSAQV